MPDSTFSEGSKEVRAPGPPPEDDGPTAEEVAQKYATQQPPTPAATELENVDPEELEPEFNADERASKREGRPITVGGKVFLPQRKTLGVMERIGELGAQVAATQEEARKENDPSKAAEVNRLTYEQISTLMRPKAAGGDEPTLEFLKAELDIDDAGPLLQFLYGVVVKGADRPQGAAPDAASPDNGSESSETAPTASEVS